MKTLETQFNSNGFTHAQVARRGNLAIYRRSKQIGNVMIEHFEVVVIRISPAWQAFGQSFPESETYPSSKLWGVDGWTFHELEAAWDKLWAIRKRRHLLSH